VRIIIECPERILHLEAGYIYADRPSSTSTLLQSGGGPYIIANDSENWIPLSIFIQPFPLVVWKIPSTTKWPKLQKRLYCPTVFPLLSLVAVEIHLIEDRIRELCGNAATVNDSEVPALFAELQTLLADHSASVRYLAAKTLKRVSHEPSPSKAAD
jgi:hypothetical protein